MTQSLHDRINKLFLRRLLPILGGMAILFAVLSHTIRGAGVATDPSGVVSYSASGGVITLTSAENSIVILKEIGGETELIFLDAANTTVPITSPSGIVLASDTITLVQSGSTSVGSITNKADSTILISGSHQGDLTNETGGNIEISSTGSLTGNLTNIPVTGTITVSGSCDTNGISNEGTLRITSSGHVSSGNLYSDYVLANAGTLSINVNGQLINIGTMTNSKRLDLNGSTTFDNRGDFTNETGAWLYLVDGMSVKNTKDSSLSTAGVFTNNGSIDVANGTGSLDLNDWNTVSGTKIINNGTMAAGYMTIGPGSGTFEDASSAVYKSMGYSFEKDSSTLNGTVIADSTTKITSAGGSFTLQVGTKSKKISGVITDEKAQDLIDNKLPSDVGWSTSPLPDFYFGQENKLLSLVTTADGYDGTPYLEYYKSGTWTDDPDECSYYGNYEVRAVAPETDNYTESHTGSFYFDVTALPLDDSMKVNATDYAALQGMANDIYTNKDTITLKAKEGYQIAFASYADADFGDSVTVSKDDLYLDTGELKSGYAYYFLRDNNPSSSTYKAITKEVWIGTAAGSICPTMGNVIFDSEEPDIPVTVVLDGSNTTIAPGTTTQGKIMELKVTDKTLDKVVVTGLGDQTLTRDNGKVAASGSVYAATVTLTATEGAAQAVTITAYDMAGNYTTLSFSLKYPLETATASVSVPDTVVGTAYDPDLTTNSDGTPVFYYKLLTDPDTAYKTTKPTAAGTYSIKVEIPATDYYTAVSNESSFTISRKTPTLSITCANTVVGTDYEPDVSTTSDGTVKLLYKKAADPDTAYDTTKPTAAGSYIVMASVPMTDTYNGASKTAAYTISRKTVAAEVTISDVTVGNDYEPTLTTESDGKASATYLYKKSTDGESAYASTKPTTVGTYTVKAVIPQTETYNEISCTATYSIIRRTADATVLVPDTIVGQSYEPVLTTESDGKSSAVYQYKKSTDDDSSYSDTKPTAVGTYTVKATVPQTATYETITCTSEFTIHSKTVGDASVEVPDTFVGTSYAPVLTTDSDGKDAAVYYYKKSSDPDSAYSTTQPTAAGTYTVKAEVPETATYAAQTCTDTFTIKKKTPEAKVEIPDMVIGTSYSPSLTTTSDKAADTVYTYKKEGDPDTAYTSTQPTAAGSYIVRASIPESDTYEAIECTDSFTISKKTPTASVSVSDPLPDTEYDPVLTTDSDAKDSASFLYKKAADDSASFAAEKPKNPGTYIVKAVIPASDTYTAISCQTTYTISKRTATLSLSCKDSYVGETYEPEYSTNSDGTVSLLYKKSADPDSAYAAGKPTAAGSYMVKAIVSATDDYSGISDTVSFTISRNTVTASVKINDITVGTDYEPVLTTVSDGKASANYLYKKSADPDTAYSNTKPTAAGSYTVKAVIPQTDDYDEITCTSTFSITRRTATATVLVPDTVIGQSYDPVLTTDSDGKASATYLYKKSTDDDSAYAGTKPTAVGTYTVKASVPQTETYEAISCTCEFTIHSKAFGTASVKVADTYVGTSYEPVLTTDSDGKASAVFTYKKSTDPDSAYSSSKPSAAGTYTVKAEIPETANYEAQTCTGTFTIKKKTPTASVAAPDTVIGTSYSPTLSTDSDKASEAVFTYKKEGDPDSAYSSAQPTAAGSYIVRASIPESDVFEAAQCTGSFTINKKTPTASLSVPDSLPGAEYEPVLTTDSDAKSSASILYKDAADTSASFAAEKPQKPGSYIAKAIIPASETYAAVSVQTTFTIGKLSANSTLSISDVYAGTDYEPVFSTTSDSKETVTFAYKNLNAKKPAYTVVRPNSPGSYMVRATLPATATYEAVSVEASYTISYLPAPSPSYELSGTKGNNSYYITDVYLKAPEGYQITRDEESGTYAALLLWDEDLSKVYLKRSSDGAYTAAISVKENLKIDKKPPFIKEATDQDGEAVKVKNGKTIKADKLKLIIFDDHLYDVQIDDESVNFDGHATTQRFEPEDESQTFKVTAYDKAGNKFETTFILESIWQEKGVIPTGKKLKLKKGKPYKLDTGSWKVSGDDTVYNGGMAVYVRSDGDYSFTKQ